MESYRVNLLSTSFQASLVNYTNPEPSISVGFFSIPRFFFFFLTRVCIANQPFIRHDIRPVRNPFFSLILLHRFYRCTPITTGDCICLTLLESSAIELTKLSSPPVNPLIRANFILPELFDDEFRNKSNSSAYNRDDELKKKKKLLKLTT